MAMAPLSSSAMAFPRPSTPAAAWRDLMAFLSERGRHRIVFAFLAILMPTLIVTAFYIDANIKPLQRVVYVQTWAENRTDDDIKAQQKIDEAKRQAAAEERQRQYQRLADQLGIDTSK